MRIIMRHLLIFSVLSMGWGTAQAHMVIYKDGIGIMSNASQEHSNFDVNYSLSHRIAVLYRHFRWLPEGAINDDDFEARNIGQVNFLLKRWNNMDSQGNVYAGVGYGEKDTASYQFEADWEDREYYIAAQYQALDPEIGKSMEISKLRIGAAPYVGSSGDLHSWLIMQYSKNTILENKESLTPILRLFYQTVLVEMGYSFDGDFSLGLMFHF